MLNGLIITACILWVLGFFVKGFCLYQILVLVPTVMFAVRKFGIHLSMGAIIGTECLFLFFSTSYCLLFGKFAFVKFLLTILLRLIFVGIVAYDDTMYVYVSEERKRNHD